MRRSSAFSFYRNTRALLDRRPLPLTDEQIAEIDLAAQVAAFEGEGGPELPDHVHPEAPRPFVGHARSVRCQLCGRLYSEHGDGAWRPSRERPRDWATHHAIRSVQS